MIQARLRRSREDVAGLANVRLCKGIYLEPPEIAYPDPDEIRDELPRRCSTRSSTREATSRSPPTTSS